MQPPPDHPGYGAPQQPQQPDYGSPYPAYPQPSQQPYPGYGAPSQQPYPGYGAPQPSQQPYPEYGAPQPSQQPYPGYGAGYGTPQPSQQPYPGYSAPSQQPYGYGTPPATAKAGLSSNAIRGLVAGGVALLLIILAVVHYNGPTATVQGYINDIFVSGNASDAFSRLCPSNQAKTSVSQIQRSIDTIRTGGLSYDTSGLTYTLIDENFFGTAHVRLGGTIAITFQGQTRSGPLNSNSSNSQVALQSSGLGWCIEDNSFISPQTANGARASLLKVPFASRTGR
jgi:hypothetical protein